MECGLTRCCLKLGGRARATNLPIGGGRITIDVTGTEATVEGLPPGMTLHRGNPSALADLMEPPEQLKRNVSKKGGMA